MRSEEGTLYFYVVFTALGVMPAPMQHERLYTGP